MNSVARRLLYVTPFSLLPRIEGHRKRMAMTFDAIKRAGFEVHVLFIPMEYEWSALFDPNIYKELLGIADLTFFCHAPTPGPPSDDIYTLDEWWPAHGDEYCKWIFGNNGYEFIFCNYIFMSRIFKLVERSTIKILDTHDIFSDRKEMLLANGLKPEFFYTSLEREVEGIERADMVLAIKEQEAQFFSKYSDVRVVTLPYFEPSPPHRRNAAPRPRAGKVRFGFFGSSNSINVKNVVEFIKYLEENQPSEGFDFDLWLYGSLCKRMPTTMPGFVKLGGIVDEVDEFYDNVDCVVNPQYFSTGLKIKVAEALAYHAPVICHRHSFEGFGDPAHPAQDCGGFDDVLAAMRKAAADPEFLEDVREASIVVETRLAKECARQMSKVLSASKVGVKWLYIFVDGGTFNRSRLYRHMVETFFWAFSKSHLTAFVSDEGDDAAGLWDHFRRRANRTASGLAADDVEADARCVFFIDPARYFEGQARSGGGVVFVDAVRIVQGHCGSARRDWLNEAAKSHVLVRCEGLGEADFAVGDGCLSVRYFRWLPWDMAVGSGADNHEQVSEVWVLGEEQVDGRWYDIVREAFPDLETRVFREDCGSGAAGACAIQVLTDMVFSNRKVPRLVIRLAADRGYDIFAEWCVANGVPFRSYIRYARPDSLGRRCPILPSRLSELTRKPQVEDDLGGTVSSWGASGWEDLARVIDKRGLVRSSPEHRTADKALAAH